MPGNDNATQQQLTPPPVICSGALRQREPAMFSGTGEYDAEDWLSSYERVGNYNRWDDSMKLASVPYSLSKVAEQWYQNNVRDFTTWAAFKTRFLGVFDRPAVRKLRAEQRLRERAQQLGENFTSYIEDVLDLCRRVDPAMTDAEKIRHILKGIDDGAFQMLIAKDPTTVSQVVSLCQSYDELRRHRVVARQSLEPVDTVSGLDLASESPSLWAKIQAFVREEVARQISCVPYVQESTSSLAPALQSVIKEQIAEALPQAQLSAPVAAPLTYAEAAARPPRQFSTFRRTGQTVSPPSPRMVPPVATPWRTPDNRPICFACGIPGHVARHCRRMPPPRPDGLRAAVYSPHPMYFPQPPHRDASFGPTPDRFSSPNRAADARRRSLSPRRRSLSPMRRRPEHVQEGN